jgi:putative tricarboxylic transport membrane protein
LIKTLRAGDTASGVFLILIGGITLIAAMQIRSSIGGMLHPATLPVILGAMLVAGGGWLIFRARAKSYTDKPIEWPDRAGWRNWGVALAMMMLYAALMQPLGFLLTTLVFITAFIWYFGKYKTWVAFAWGLGTVLFIYVLFIWLLQMAFPSGILPF